MNLLSQAELKVLNSDMHQFPMIAAASAALKRCGTCGAKQVNIRALLLTALTKYHKNPLFKERLREITGLPVILAGFYIE